MQTTLKSPVTFTGKGLHSGQKVRLAVLPASAEHGIWFRRTDVNDVGAMIPARWDAVVPSRLCTKLANAHGVSVSTVEHLMAALAGCGIRNALIEIDGPEVPVLDGSSAKFVEDFLDCGVQVQSVPTRAIRVLGPVEVQEGEAAARIEPAPELEIDFSIDFDDQAIGVQAKSLRIVNGAFIRELCDSRTFCRWADVGSMRSIGLALGGTLENAVVVDDDKVLSPGGFRYPDEAVRHKMLDAMGDLALAAYPILGRYTGICAGHALNNRLLRALLTRPEAFCVVQCDGQTVARLPGAGVSRSLLEGLKHTDG